MTGRPPGSVEVFAALRREVGAQLGDLRAVVDHLGRVLGSAVGGQVCKALLQARQKTLSDLRLGLRPVSTG